MGEGLKIIKLVAENVKGLKAIEITPDEHFQIVSGENGNGKTSVLDSIWMALGGAEASKNVDRPIRDGEEEAYAYLDMGDIIVIRKWRRTGTSQLEVRTKDGAKYASPQKVLDGLIGKISFDPGAFILMDDAKQKKALMDLLGIDAASFDKRIKEVYDARTVVNAEVRNLKGTLETLLMPTPGIPEEEVSAADIFSQIQAANETIAANNRKRDELTTLRNERDRLKMVDLAAVESEISELERKLAEARGRRERISDSIEQVQQRGTVLLVEVNALVDPDITELQTKLQDVEGINRKVREAKEYKRIESLHSAKDKESKQLTQQIKKIEQEKEQAISSAEFPIEGIGFDDTGITFNGVPLKQCSDAEQLKVVMAIAMKLNPEVRVIRITRGSLFDKKNMQVIADMAKENNYQVWMEVVDESGTMGVVLEAGEVKAVNKREEF